MTGPALPASTVDDLLAGFHPVEATVSILFDARLLAEHADLEGRLAGIRKSDVGGLAGSDEAHELADELAVLEARMDAASAPFTFRSIGRQAWRRLIGEHPPTREQARQGLDHNPDTFPVAAIAASCVAPEITVADVERLEAALNYAQFDKLWAGCLEANLGGGATPKSVAGSILRSSAALASTAAREVSRAASSSDE